MEVVALVIAIIVIVVVAVIVVGMFWQEILIWVGVILVGLALLWAIATVLDWFAV